MVLLKSGKQQIVTLTICELDLYKGKIHVLEDLSFKPNPMDVKDYITYITGFSENFIYDFDYSLATMDMSNQWYFFDKRIDSEFDTNPVETTVRIIRELSNCKKKDTFDIYIYIYIYMCVCECV